MRRIAEVAALSTLAVLYWITYAALNGADRLPLRVPTHFDISGKPNAWGSPEILWLLPLIGTGLYLLMTALASIRFRSYNLPLRVTEANLPFIYSKTGEMVAWIKFEVLSMFLYIQSGITRGARSGEFHLSPAIVPAFITVVLVTVGWYLKTIIRGAKVRAESFDSINKVQS